MQYTSGGYSGTTTDSQNMTRNLYSMRSDCQRGINQVAPALLLYDVWKGVDLLLDNY